MSGRHDDLEKAQALFDQAMAKFRKASYVLCRPENTAAVKSMRQVVDIIGQAMAAVAREVLVQAGAIPRNKALARSMHWSEWIVMLAPAFGKRAGTTFVHCPEILIETELFANGTWGVCWFPDLGWFEKEIIREAREVIGEAQARLRLDRSSMRWKAFAKRVREQHHQWRSDTERHRLLRGRDRKARQILWPDRPIRRVAVFEGGNAVRAKAVIGQHLASRTTVPISLARSCDAYFLPETVPAPSVYGDTRPFRRVVPGRPVLMRVSIPRTPWTAVVLALALPSRECRVPRLGEDWLSTVQYAHQKNFEKRVAGIRA